jgi:hypothetical protein
MNIPGESSLRYFDPAPPQLPPQVVLVRHCGLRQHFPYRIQALMFHCRFPTKIEGAVREAETALV